MSEISELRSHANSLWRTLAGEWYEVRSEWRDGVGLRFEQSYWNEMERTMSEFDTAMGEFDSTLSQAQQIMAG